MFFFAAAVNLMLVSCRTAPKVVFLRRDEIKVSVYFNTVNIDFSRLMKYNYAGMNIYLKKNNMFKFLKIAPENFYNLPPDIEILPQREYTIKDLSWEKEYFLVFSFCDSKKRLLISGIYMPRTEIRPQLDLLALYTTNKSVMITYRAQGFIKTLELKRSDFTDGKEKIIPISPAHTNFLDSELESNNRYTYFLRAVFSNGFITNSASLAVNSWKRSLPAGEILKQYRLDYNPVFKEW